VVTDGGRVTLCCFRQLFAGPRFFSDQTNQAQANRITERTKDRDKSIQISVLNIHM
jgi:hypothetical protein